jgi:hypothetical protein
MRYFFLLMLFFNCAYSQTWKYKIIHPNGKEELYRIEEKKKKILIPKGKWICHAVDLLEDDKSAIKAITCNYGKGTVILPSSCSKDGAKENSFHTLHIADDSKEEKYYRLSLWCE